jgi:spore germination protein
MMAYDFAVASSQNAMPTDPLYGASTGKYWYDVSTAVNDFLTQMPANKLILGVPYYGYNYMVYSPTVKAETLASSWRGSNVSETYSFVSNNVTAQMSGWDKEGEVGWKAYYDSSTQTWRIVFADDVKSLSLKYDFAKSKNLEGVGMWALGNDDGHSELWALLADKFGLKLADAQAERRVISD